MSDLPRRMMERNGLVPGALSGPGEVMSEVRDPRPNRMLVVALGGIWHVLDRQGEAFRGDESVHDIVEGRPELDGIIAWEGDWKPIGVSDSHWGDPLEYGLVGTWRHATLEEWERFNAGDFVWEEWHEPGTGK